MTVDNSDVIDAIGIENATGCTVLTIADHLEWSPLRDHLVLLQDKINRYIAFLENNEMAQSYPQGIGRPIRIDVCCQHEPTEQACDFLHQAASVIQEAGWSFSWRVFHA